MLSAGASVAGSVGSEVRGEAKKPNILFLMTDQHRFDCLGCAGNKVIRTPNLDSIAREGVRFESAYTSTPSCTPARAGLLTGLSPWHHGMLGYGRVAQRYTSELPRALREAGYHTFGIGKMHWFPQKSLHGFHGTLVDESGRVETKGFTSDYRLWFREQAPGLDPDATGIGWNEWREGVYALPERLHPTHWTGQTAVDFIEKYDRKEPFLLKVSFARPHSPYDPPRRFLEMYREDDIPAPHVGEWAKRFARRREPPKPSLWRGDLGVEQAKRSRRAYYGSVSFIDEEIGRIVGALKRRGMYDNTLVIFCTDHGDMLGDHHHWRKTYAYEGSAKIPMLLRWPVSMEMDGERGKTRPEPVELRDVLPTFLDAAGARIPNGLDGASMLGLVRDERARWRPHIDLEHDRCYSRENQWNALTDGRWKYVYFSVTGQEQLFDLENDPGELVDLAGDAGRRRELSEWRGRMVEHFAERGREFVSGGRLVRRSKRKLYSPHYPKNPKIP
jgi:arylsulfatase A-like enzyme